MLILFFDKYKDSMELALKQNNIIEKEKQKKTILLIIFINFYKNKKNYKIYKN